MFPEPLTLTQCRTRLGVACYTPRQIRTAYGLTGKRVGHLTGKDVTVVTGIGVIPKTIQHDLDVFSDRFGLPRTKLELAYENGASPSSPQDASNYREAILDVSAIHAMAPRARIVVVAAPTIPNQHAGDLPPAYLDALERYDGDVLSMSWNNFEELLSQQDPALRQGSVALERLREPLVRASEQGVTIMGSSGDWGGLAPSVGALWPTADPVVTSVGGTVLDLDADGHRLRPDTGWNASSGGLSSWFARPAYQDPVSRLVGTRRGEPDISMMARSFWVHDSAGPQPPGWQLVGGTSLSAPLMAGIVALAVEAAGHRLGNINETLYRLGERPGGGIVDVTTGQSSRDAHVGAHAAPTVPEPPGWHGYTAHAGYDLVTGLGTVDGERLIPSLAAAGRGKEDRHEMQEDAVPDDAATSAGK
ncbi:S8 family serine peptidase [Streptomyces sp. NPDC048639]|uniref:S53 family peptidase n=1 Tax=Streptomyces sp. NPDC048639 TaxID=3365581 RepID=UPI00371F3CA7